MTRYLNKHQPWHNTRVPGRFNLPCSYWNKNVTHSCLSSLLNILWVYFIDFIRSCEVQLVNVFNRNCFLWKTSFTVYSAATPKLLLILLLCGKVNANTPPRFIVENNSEIVVHFKEGQETPVGTIIANLKGYDPDEDALTFGILGDESKELLQIRPLPSKAEAQLILKSLLDREIREEYQIILTLTDGKLGENKFITQSLLLLVEDINDNVPIFDAYEPRIAVKENTLPQILTTLSAVDRDEGPYGQVVYSLDSMDKEDFEIFSVRTHKGQAELRLIGQLDYEKKPLYQLQVLAVDRSPGGRINTGTAAFVVEVKDVEDMNPTFIKAPPVTRIAENIPVNSYVLQVYAIDGDRGINNEIEYSIDSGDHGFFELEPSTGYLYVKQPLDREYDGLSGAFFIKIIAKEITSAIVPRPTAQTEITVVLEDVNDQTPTFANSHYIGEISEGSQFNMPVNLIGDAIPEVYDNDQGINGTFNLEIQGDNGLFEVTPSGGLNTASFLIRIKSPHLLDFEVFKEINFTIIAKEVVDNEPKSSSAMVTVHITDSNDNVPEFSEIQYVAHVKENADVSTPILTVQATDIDSGEFGTSSIRYTDIRGSHANKVQINELTGEVTLRETPSFDREALSEIFLTIEARDHMGKGNRNTVGVKVIIDDENDNKPVFIRDNIELRLYENDANFSEPLIVSATDSDLKGTPNSEIRYKIVSGDTYKNFTIDNITGEIQPMRSLDFEAMKMGGDVRYFNLTIQAYDLGSPSLSSTTSVLIYLIDVNDNRPKFEKLMYQTEILENTIGGTELIHVHAHDADGSVTNSRIAYRIQDGAKDKFVIEPSTGRILVAEGAVLDPDNTQPRTSLYTLKVVAIDGGLGSFNLKETAIVEIKIKDVNNKLPTFKPIEPISIAENEPSGTFVVQLEAVDPDESSSLRYSLDFENSVARNPAGAIVKMGEFNYSSIFSIDPLDGMIRLGAGLDREKIETLRLVAKCEDIQSDTGLQMSTVVLLITIIDTNDNDPIFRKNLYKGSVSENAELGAFILNVLADDKDSQQEITYELMNSGEASDLLHLDNLTGEIVVRKRIDRERFQWLNFTVKASDAGDPVRFNFVDVSIKVLDENDNNPEFDRHLTSLNVREDAPIGTEVIAMTAHDPDAGPYGKLTYLLDKKSSKGFFRINKNTGMLSVAQKLNREEDSQFNLIIEVWDNYEFGHLNGESRNAFTQIAIIIADVNDEIPIIKHSGTCATVSELDGIGHVITTLIADDKDDPTTGNGRVKFDITKGNDLGLFDLKVIDVTSVEIISAKSLVGFYGNYTLGISARDMGVPPNSAQQDINICVHDYNDHAPEFISPLANVTIRIAENTTIGSLVIRVQAIDKDVGANGAILYRIKKDHKGHSESFSVEQETGYITLRKPLDKEVQRLYNIRVEAYDQGLPTPLSSDLDLTIYVQNINDFAPQFAEDLFVVNFTEHERPGEFKVVLPKTLDMDELDEGESPVTVCYFILSGNVNNAFGLDSITHELTNNLELDREERSYYTLIVKADEGCFSSPKPITYFDPKDNTLLKVIVYLNDINDNPPKFNRTVFTGGITTNSDFGHEVLQLHALDPDYGKHAEVSYYLIESSMAGVLSEGSDSLPKSPFLVDATTGIVRLNFLPRQGMKGYFDFEVSVNDTAGMSDKARVFIYLLREDQRVRFILRMKPNEVRDSIHYLRDSLGNVTNAIVNVDAYRAHRNVDGSVDKTKTDLYLHLVKKNDHSVMEVTEVLTTLDRNVDHLDPLFKELNILETQGTELMLLTMTDENVAFVWLVGLVAFLALLLLVTITLCLTQRCKYVREIKAASATAFGSQETGLNRGSTVPNTNLHSVEGSNPIWLSGFDNEWFKEDDSLRYHQFISHPGEGTDSLDNNALNTSLNRDFPSLTLSNIPNPISENNIKNHSGKIRSKPIDQPILKGDNYRSNISQPFNKLPNPIIEKQLETTEL